MSILGPKVSPRISAVTLTLASFLASAVTLPSSTSSTAGSSSDSPGRASTLSISRTSPTATFCCWPPLRTIAYTADSLSRQKGMARHTCTRADLQGYGLRPSSVKAGRALGHARRLQRGRLGRFGRGSLVGRPVGGRLGPPPRRRLLRRLAARLRLGLLRRLLVVRLRFGLLVRLRLRTGSRAAALATPTGRAVVGRGRLRLDRLGVDDHAPALAVLARLTERL